MAIVVNEFEVIPAESAPLAAERTESARPAAKPRDPERELRRSLQVRQARALRLMAT